MNPITIALPDLVWQGDWFTGKVILGDQQYNQADSFLLAPPLRSQAVRSAFAIALSLRDHQLDNASDFIDLLSRISELSGPGCQRSLERLQDCWDLHEHKLTAAAMGPRLLLEARRIERAERLAINAAASYLPERQWSQLPENIHGLDVHPGEPNLGLFDPDKDNDYNSLLCLRLWCDNECPMPQAQWLVDEHGYHELTDQASWVAWRDSDDHHGLEAISMT